jgi:GxxExxY protein
MQDEILTEKIIGCAMRVHNTLGPGFLGSVYQTALLHELHKSGLLAEPEKRIRVMYDGLLVGDFIADILVDGRILIENKAVRALTAAHEVQVVNYLTATGIEVGLLLNFGTERLEFKRKYRVHRCGTASPVQDDEI